MFKFFMKALLLSFLFIPQVYAIESNAVPLQKSFKCFFKTTSLDEQTDLWLDKVLKENCDLSKPFQFQTRNNTDETQYKSALICCHTK